MPKESEQTEPIQDQLNDGLLWRKLKGQRGEIIRLCNELQQVIGQEKRIEPKSGKPRNNWPIVIEIHGERIGHERHCILRTTSKWISVGFAQMTVRDATLFSSEARKAFGKGHFHDAFLKYIHAERKLGAAHTILCMKDINREMAVQKARASHRQRTYAVKERVLQFWRANIDRTVSASKAAEIVSERYLALHGLEVAFTTLSEWISSEKKRISRA